MFHRVVLIAVLVTAAFSIITMAFTTDVAVVCDACFLVPKRTERSQGKANTHLSSLESGFSNTTGIIQLDCLRSSLWQARACHAHGPARTAPVSF